MVIENECESSSSEDEASKEMLKEVADDFLKQLFENKEKKNEGKSQSISNSDFRENNGCVNDNTDSHEYTNHGLSQFCRNFISKKLNSRLDVEFMKDKTILPHKEKEDANTLTGIKLFSSSGNLSTANIEFTEDNNTLPKHNKRRKLNGEDLAKCKEVAISAETIISQSDTIHWTTRKPIKYFKYQKLKNGVLQEIK